jgi:CDP-glucose 4,6-dehydratase
LSIYEKRRVLVTGHTGFKGAWLSTWLAELGAEVSGLAQPPEGEPNLFAALDLADRMASSSVVDIRDKEAVVAEIDRLKPEIVFHLAAQALVRRSYADPIETFATNVLGTANVLEACRLQDSVKAVVCVTTDKVYQNHEWVWPYRENDRLGGKDPYSASKACAEIVASVYQGALNREDPVRIATARGGNVVGGGDWSADRIVPDIVRALTTGSPIVLRNPGAVRPWQHVLELCEGYLELGARLLAGEREVEGAWNFGPFPTDQTRVDGVVSKFLETWGAPGHQVDLQPSPLHEARLLRLDVSKAMSGLDWRPRLSIDDTIALTAEWYRSYYRDPGSAHEVTCNQLRRFRGAVGGAA